MNTSSDSTPNDTLLAAEFVLGLLSPDEHMACEARMQHEVEFAAEVDVWEHTLSPMLEAVQPVQAPVGAFDRLEARLFPSKQPIQTPSNAQAWWQHIAAVCLTLLLSVAIWSFMDRRTAHPDLIGAITLADGGSVFVLADHLSERLHTRTLGFDAPSEQAAELWIIAGNDNPVSLGLLTNKNTQLEVSGDVLDLLHAGNTLAVSLEPPGGSATGLPTGPILGTALLESLSP